LAKTYEHLAIELKHKQQVFKSLET